MSLLKEFTATPENRTFSVRVEKALQHIDVQRISKISVTQSGLVLGLPELVSAEITHPVRSRVRNANDTPFAHIALWAQHGRGPIQEIYQRTDGTMNVYDTRFKYYLNDLGPVEILADDHFVIKIEDCIPGATYRIYGPEQQVIGGEANRYFSYETAIILPTDRERTLAAAGKQGIILPNRPDAIERVVIRVSDKQGNVSENELDLFELMAVQADSNPFVSVLTDAPEDQLHSFLPPNGIPGDGPIASIRSNVFSPSQYADLFLLMFNDVQSIQIDLKLGQELKYTMIGVTDRV